MSSGLSYARRVLNQEDRPLRVNVFSPPQPVQGIEVSKKRFSGKRGASKRTRLHIMQKGQCFYCWHVFDLNHWSIDHRIALCCGGSNRVENLIGACKTCNKKKGALSEREFVDSEYIKVRRSKIC